MRRAVRPILALALAGALAGCASSGGRNDATGAPGPQSPTVSPAGPGTPVPTVTLSVPTSSVRATSTATPWTRAAARTRFAAIVAPVQEAVSKLVDAPTDADLATARSLLERIVRAESDAVGQLAAGAWPSAARHHVDQLIATALTARDLLTSVAALPSLKAMHARASDIVTQLQIEQAAAQAVQSDLGG